jgi:hypothetical protein
MGMGVFRRQSDQHHQSDLSIDVILAEHRANKSILRFHCLIGAEPVAARAFNGADRYSLKRMVNSGPVGASNLGSAESGTISPAEFHT